MFSCRSFAWKTLGFALEPPRAGHALVSVSGAQTICTRAGASSRVSNASVQNTDDVGVALRSIGAVDTGGFTTRLANGTFAIARISYCGSAEPAADGVPPVHARTTSDVSSVS